MLIRLTLQRLPTKAQPHLRKLQFLRQQMHYFVSLIEEYVLYEVIHSQWLHFKKGLASLTLFEELVDLHNSYLDTVLERCFLRGTVNDGRGQTDVAQEKKIQSTLGLIFSQVFKLNHLLKEYGTGICSEEEAIADLSNVYKNFMETAVALYHAVRNMAYKGQH